MLRPVLLALLLTGTATHAFAQPPAETVPLLREIKNWVTGCDNLRNCRWSLNPCRWTAPRCKARWAMTKPLAP